MAQRVLRELLDRRVILVLPELRELAELKELVALKVQVVLKARVALKARVVLKARSASRGPPEIMATMVPTVLRGITAIRDKKVKKEK